MLEPKRNPNPSLIVDPPAPLRWVISKLVFASSLDSAAIEKRRRKAEARRRARGVPHVVEYFHQLDDPYSHLAAQVLSELVARYDIELRLHLIRATGGSSQPEFQKLAVWARKDTELIAPHFSLSFPTQAGTVPDPDHRTLAGRALVGIDVATGGELDRVQAVSKALWSGDEAALRALAADRGGQDDLEAGLDAGSARLSKLGHYSGAMFYYEGEWYWGVDRLSHLEHRLRALGACKEPDSPLISPRPEIDLSGVDASGLRLDFYPSLNSPYTSIIYDRTIALKDTCGIQFHLKPVLPMVMRGLPIPRPKAGYIMFDTKREADAAGVPFGNLIFPIGTPTRRAYSLLPWATAQGKAEVLLSSLLKHTWALGVGLHREAGMKRAVQAAGLDWDEARRVMNDEDWKPIVEANQDEMVEGLGLWGVPSYRLSGPSGEPDVAVWGQDRLWLIAAEIARRCGKSVG